MEKLTDNTIGKARELFALQHFQNAGLTAHYTDSGDFKVSDVVFEVGGKHKTLAQIKTLDHAYVLADGILVGAQRRIPLYLLGLLYQYEHILLSAIPIRKSLASPLRIAYNLATLVI